MAYYFLEKFSSLYNKSVKGFSDKVLTFFKDYPFPGNVRELKNMIERAVLTCENEIIDINDITHPFSPNSFLTKPGTKFDNIIQEETIKPLSELEKEAILKALQVCRGNKTKAAELLGITVRTLRNKLKQYQKEGLI